MDATAVVEQRQAATHGRGDRVARTREAIVSSTLTLALEGEVAPIVRDIARLAGVSARTVFQHFADTAELYLAVLGRVLLSLVGEPPEASPQSPLEQRVTRIISHRSDHFEKLLPMWAFVATLQRRSTDASEKVVQMYTTNREQLDGWFAPELAALDGDRRERMLNALAVALSPESWNVLRDRLGLTVVQAREEMRFIVTAILTDNAAAAR